MSLQDVKEITKGLITLVPGIKPLLPTGKTGGSDSAEYCYGVWLKHLTLMWASGVRTTPHTLAELGPGDSLGVGLAALLTGVDAYFGLDVVRFSNTEKNLQVFERLVALFRARAPRPNKGWPDFDEHLDARLFPSHILTEARLNAALSEQRIAAIRNAIRHPGQKSDGIVIQYFVPWFDTHVIEKESVDWILSHGVVHYIDDLDDAYRKLYAWLKPGGAMSHQIPLYDMDPTKKAWNGFRAYSEWQWKLIAGKRMITNRQPHSVHMALLKKNGFTILNDLQRYRDDGIARSRLAAAWQHLSDEDLRCDNMFVQVRK